MSLEFAIERMIVDEGGVKDFFWPVSYAEKVAMRDTFFRKLVVVAKGQGDDDEDAALLSIVFNYFALEAMKLYQIYVLTKRMAQCNRSVVWPERWPVTLAMIEKQTLPQPSMLQHLREGPERVTRWSMPFSRRELRHKIQASLRWNDGGIKGWVMTFFKKDVATILVPNETLYHYGDFVTQPMRLSFVTDWFGPLHRVQFEQTASRESVICGAIEAVQAGFEAGGESLPDHLAQYCRDYLVQAMGSIDAHLQKLLRRPKRLPKKLWTGTGGIIWARILRHAVRRTGGEVTGFAHGWGGAGCWEAIAVTLTEFESCDCFVTYTEQHAKALEEGVVKDLLIPPTPPKVIAPPSLCETPFKILQKRYAQPTSPPAKLKKVMYPSTVFDGERPRMILNFPDIVAIDWQSRFLAYLKQWGYEVIQKHHPESPVPPPIEFERRFQAKLSTEIFEDVLDSADVLIFDYSRSTSFGSALVSSKPVVLIDFGFSDWMPEARQMLAKRCRIVSGWFDKDNRAQIDWIDLKLAITEAPNLKDQTFIETYLVQQ